jgi:ATP-dependent exoDNAse (exonuclease V) alpha subunit
VFEGDIVQTRRNDSISGVDNRQTWIVKKITTDHMMLASISDASDLRKVSQEYAASYLHLGYASTVYGVQGETTDRSLVGPDVDAAGLYVGLTRGRKHNDVVLTAPTPEAARSQLIEMMQRKPIEETLDKSRAAARIELDRAAKANIVQASPIVDGLPDGRTSSINAI